MIVYGLDIHNKQEVIKWLNKLREGTGDARPLWMAMIPKIKEFVNYEFHPTIDSHKGWASLKQKYKEMKIKYGYAPGIGVRKGWLRYGAGEKAIVKMNEKTLMWILNPNPMIEHEGEDYSIAFHKGHDNVPARPIYKYTALRVNSFLTLDAKRFADGSVHANFTYNWFKNVLEKSLR